MTSRDTNCLLRLARGRAQDAKRDATLADDQTVQTQLRALGIRYFLEFRGGTKTDTKGGMVCSYGCIGFVWGSRQSSFSAYLLDIQKLEVLAEENVVRGGRVFVPAFLLPVPLIAATKTSACQELAEKIHAAIVRGTP